MADNDTVEMCVLSLISFGMALPQNIRPTDIRKVYGFALAGIADGAVKAATEKLMRGGYGPEYTDFIPTPPRLSSFAQIEQARIVAELARERARTNPQTDKRTTPEPTPEQKANVRRVRELFKAQAPAFSRPYDAPQHEGDQSRREYFAKIASLPDRPAITAEEMQNRSHILSSTQSLETAK